MGSVTNIDPSQDLGHFFDFMYGGQEGYAYSPTKNPDPDNPVFEQYFFYYPKEREELIQHVLQKTQTLEVYYGPALYTNKKDAEKESYKGTNFVWVEFDGNTPANVSDIPEPSLKIQSSIDSHQHWYWKLDHFVEDINILEDVTQRLAYHLNADLGCWNANRVLRPPGTTHHESGQRVTTLRMDPRPLPIRSFNELPAVPVRLIQDSDINFIPQALEVIAKYAWEGREEDFKFFMTPKIDRGHRSSALTKLGHICIEIGMTNAETLSVLLNADSRWGKFSKRRDQKARLLGIINYCRSRHPVDVVEEQAESRLKVYTYEEFVNTELKVEWVVEGLIHKKGRVIMSGPAGVGKSQATIRFAEKLARGEKFLKWTPVRPMRTLLVSMEMPHEELYEVMDNMHITMDDMLRENLLIMPLGYSIKLNNTASQAELAAVVEEFKPDGILFDSLGVGIGEDLSSDKIVFDTFHYIKRVLCDHYGAFTWFIHHNRKAQIGNKKPTSLDDLFGSQYIGAEITTGLNLWKSSKAVDAPIEMSCLKMRMSKMFDPFMIKRTPDLDFSVVESGDSPDRDAKVFDL